MDPINDFSLDMISSDMDFETAYGIYNGLQQQIAKNEVENLEKVQQLNHSYKFDAPFMEEMGSEVQEPIQVPIDDDRRILEAHRQQIIQGLKPTNNQFIVRNGIESEKDNTHYDYANLLSQRESNAIEQFLDSIDSDGDLSSFLGLPPAPVVKSQLHEAFRYRPEYESPLNSNNYELARTKNDDYQLPTPASTGISNGKSLKRSSTESSSSQSPSDDKPKRKRVTKKPLLSDEQKKLNHSNSEQKRRQLIKLAFERVSNLILEDDEKKKEKNLSKYVVLSRMVAQMNNLIDINQKLRALGGVYEVKEIESS